MMVQVTAQLLGREVMGAVQELRLHAPALTRQLAPGQPILVRTGWGTDPYLRRTLYPIAWDDETWTARLGPSPDRGHSWLRMAPVGAHIDCLGPVGKGFALPPRARNILCLGEDETCWVLAPAVQQADAGGLSVTLAVQATTPRYTIPANRLPLAVEYRLATAEGGRGRKGELAPILPELLAWADAALIAGSLSFCRQIADRIQEVRMVLNRGFAQALYPAAFLCGVGACLACVADIAGGRRRVCVRGPVFDLVDIVR